MHIYIVEGVTFFLYLVHQPRNTVRLGGYDTVNLDCLSGSLPRLSVEDVSSQMTAKLWLRHTLLWCCDLGHPIQPCMTCGSVRACPDTYNAPPSGGMLPVGGRSSLCGSSRSCSRHSTHQHGDGPQGVSRHFGKGQYGNGRFDNRHFGYRTFR